MSQHIVHDPTSAEYSGGLDMVWQQWEPALRRAERMLRGGTDAFEYHHDEAGGGESIEFLRRCQYRAHTAAEFASGLRPPLAAVDAHEYLVASLEASRDTLGVLAVRAELDELDEQVAEIGLHAVSSTRDAFSGARNSSIAAFRFTETIEPIYVRATPIESRGMGIVLWGLVAVCAVLFAVLLFEVFLLSAPTS
jgi:hypothetical protein